MALQEHGDADFGGSAVVRGWKKGVWCEDEGDGESGKRSTRGMRVSPFFFFLVILRSILLLILFYSPPASLSVRFRQQHIFFFTILLFVLDGWTDGRTDGWTISLALYYLLCIP